MDRGGRLSAEVGQRCGVETHSQCVSCSARKTLHSLGTLERVTMAKVIGCLGLGEAFIWRHSTKLEVYFKYSQGHIFFSYLPHRHTIDKSLLLTPNPRPRSDVGPLKTCGCWDGLAACSVEIFRA